MSKRRFGRLVCAHVAGRARGLLTLAIYGRFRVDSAFLYRFPKLDIYGELSVGKRFTCMGRIVPVSLSVAPRARLVIDDDVFLNQGTRVHAENTVVIGARTEIGDYVAIYDTNFHAVAPGDQVITAPVIVEEDCWIGTGATLLPGVTLGRGCVVAAGSVVTSSFTSGNLIGGSPAKVLRTFEVPLGFRRRGPSNRGEKANEPQHPGTANQPGKPTIESHAEPKKA